MTASVRDVSCVSRVGGMLHLMLPQGSLSSVARAACAAVAQ
jgi:chemotaxis receptor (MCP) glutamine deamidase CheD